MNSLQEAQAETMQDFKIDFGTSISISPANGYGVCFRYKGKRLVASKSKHNYWTVEFGERFWTFSENNIESLLLACEQVTQP